MGTGAGAGVGTGKGMKGTWRVNAFLLLLTGWQAVLLPWSPLILKDAGFSATSVGLLSGGSTLAASLGVVACLRAMRKSRSGAVRRLFLWLVFAGATLLQSGGVMLLLEHIPHKGLLQSCVSGWSFTTTMGGLPLNMSSSSGVLSQRPQSLAPNINITITTSTSINIPPALTFFTSTLTTTTTTTPPVPISFISPEIIATTTPIINSTVRDTILPTAALTSTSRPTHITLPPTKTTQKINYKVTNIMQPMTNVYSGEGDEEYSEDAGKVISKETPEKSPHKSPATKGKSKATHKSKGKNNKEFHTSYVSVNDLGRDKTYHPTTEDRKKPSHSKDQLASHEYYDDDDTSPHDLYEDDNSEEDEDEEDEVDYEDTPPKHINDDSRSGGESSVPSRGFQQDMRTRVATNPWKPHPQRPTSRHETLLQKHQDANSFFSKENNANGKFASLLNEQMNSGQSINLNPPSHHFHSQLNTGASHHPARPLPVFASRPATHVIKNLHVSDWQHDNHDGQARSRHTKYRRSKRSMHPTVNARHAVAAKADTNKTVHQHNETLESKWNAVKEFEDTGFKVGVAVLLMLGGLLGAGVEAGVAQLWHCYVHGYDEGGVSQDVLQRTITHTFHLSTHGSHKSWTGITSGGWVMTAGVVSIVACLAGTGGNGYGGLLSMHLTLGVASLLLLLVLPVPYGSIDPPKTRRPLSLYLDDEVLREGVRRLTFHLWVFLNGCLATLSLTFSLWLLQEMTSEGWLMGSQAAAVAVTFTCESVALHTQRRLVVRWGLQGLMGVCGVSLMLHYGVMWASESVGVMVAAHSGLGVAMAFLWVAVKHNALLLATVSDQEREAWASWWCWRLGLGVGAAAWSVGVSGAGGQVRPLLPLAAVTAAILATVLCVAAVLSKRHSRARRRVYHTLDLDMADEDDDGDEDAAEDDWLVKRARKEGLTL